MTLVKVRLRFVQIRELAGAGICPGTQMGYYHMILSSGWMSVGVSVMVAENIVVIRKLSSYSARPIFFVAFLLTARRLRE